MLALKPVLVHKEQFQHFGDIMEDYSCIVSQEQVINLNTYEQYFSWKIGNQTYPIHWINHVDQKCTTSQKDWEDVISKAKTQYTTIVECLFVDLGT